MDGKGLIFNRIGAHLDEAKTQLLKKRNALEGVIVGNQPVPTLPAIRLDAAIEEYLFCADQIVILSFRLQ
jgi:hypothetical protein